MISIFIVALMYCNVDCCKDTETFNIMSNAGSDRVESHIPFPSIVSTGILYICDNPIFYRDNNKDFFFIKILHTKTLYINYKCKHV